MTKIKDFIEAEFKGQRLEDISKELDISTASASIYKQKEVAIPALRVAKKVYARYGVALYPYCEEALKDLIEIDKGVKND